jgi:hypothetical protein
MAQVLVLPARVLGRMMAIHRHMGKPRRVRLWLKHNYADSIIACKMHMRCDVIRVLA